MRFKITQRILSGSYETSCSNACRELNANIPQDDERLTQKIIDSDGAHRKGFYAFLTQIKQAVFPSTQIVK